MRRRDDRYLFTHLSVPAMTRLRITDRSVLDTLVNAGVASSRSEALAWCVRFVGENQKEWLDGLINLLSVLNNLQYLHWKYYAQ